MLGRYKVKSYQPLKNIVTLEMDMIGQEAIWPFTREFRIRLERLRYTNFVSPEQI
jgi:hypothetical protein